MAHRYGALFLLGLSACGRRGVAAAEAADISALVQGPVQLRHLEASEEEVLDFDGCPAERSFVEALKAQELPALSRTEALTKDCGEGGETGRAGRRDCGLKAMRKEGEQPMKEVYFMRHAQPICCADCGLDRRGVEQVEGLKANNTLLHEGPLSSDPAKQAQVVFMSPTTRTMETALRLFGHLGIPMVVDFNLVEAFGYKPASSCVTCVKEMLQDINRTDILPQFYYKLQDAAEKWQQLVNSNPEVRIGRFVRRLQQRAEDRIVVVSHHMLLENMKLGMDCMDMGETVLKFRLSEDSWYADSPMSCARRRRRWPYGNYQKKGEEEAQEEDEQEEMGEKVGS